MIWPLLACFWVAQSQVWNTYNLWVRDHINLNVGGFMVPVPWLQSIDGLMPALSLPIMLALWKKQAAKGSEPELLTKMGIGCLLFGTAILLLVIASHPLGGSGRASLLFPIGFHILSNVGWLYFSPVSATLVLTRTPEPARGTMYGIAMLAVTAGSLVSGRLGGLYDRLPPASFWLIHAAIVAGAGLAFLLLARPLTRRLPEAEEPTGLPAEAIDALPQPA